MSQLCDFQRFGLIAVLFGGRSAERDISLRSGQAVIRSLERSGARVLALDTGEPFLQTLVTQRPDSAFVALHGRGGEDGHIQAILEELDIPYTGSGVAASALAMNKHLTKAVWEGMGLPTPASRLLEAHTDPAAVQREVGSCIVLKPVLEGSSLGITIASTTEEIAAGYRHALAYDDSVLAERFIEGEEYTVSLLDGCELPSIRMKPSAGFYDYAAKYERDDTRYDLPSGLSPSEEKTVQSLAEQAFRVLGCQGWGRVDLMRDASGAWWLLEVNTLPGLTDHSLVPMAAAAAGINFTQLIYRILALAEHEQ